MTDDASSRERAAEWFSLQLDAENWSGADEEKFRAWLSESEENRREYECTKKAYAVLAQQDVFPKEAFSEAKREARISNPWKIASAFAMLLLLCGLTFFYLNRGVSYETGTAELREITLPDGTLAHLGAETRLVCHFDEKERWVKLKKGHAVFKVAEHPSQPFGIQTSHFKIRDIGTTFEVGLNSHQLAVAVEEGIVDVFRKDSAHAVPIRLTEGKSLVWSDHASSPEIDLLEKGTFASWRQGRIYYSGQTLENVAEELQRYSKLKIRIADDSLKNLKITGTIRTGNIEHSLKMLTEILPLRLKITNKEILVEKAG